MRLHLTGTETVEPLVVEDDRLVVEVRYADAHARPPAHLHPAHDECFEVVAGRIGARIGRESREYVPGEEFEVRRGTVHQMWPVGGPAAATWECRPGARSLDWFRALDELHRRGLRGPVRGLALAALVGAHDDVFRLASGPRPLLRAATRAAALVTRDGRLLR